MKIEFKKEFSDKSRKSDKTKIYKLINWSVFSISISYFHVNVVGAYNFGFLFFI